MKKFIVDTGNKKYKVEANTYDEAISAVKIILQKDEASPLQTVNALLEDEHAAVDAYNVALENLKGKIPDESYAAIEAIRNDENRHIENLQAVVNGNVTEKNLQDSKVKDVERKDFNDVRVIESSGQVSIGWASLGAVSIAEAENFMRDLQKAINYAKTQR